MGANMVSTGIWKQE